MSNDTHPQQPDGDPWHTWQKCGQYRFGQDITGGKSWQCKYAGLTIYGMESREEAIEKIRELIAEKTMSEFFHLDNE